MLVCSSMVCIVFDSFVLYIIEQMLEHSVYSRLLLFVESHIMLYLNNLW